MTGDLGSPDGTGSTRTGSGSATGSLLPSISLPKGGGALQGIGEKFAIDAARGTGTLTIPVAVSPGRSGFTPSLALAYDAGSGNGPFGLGVHLSIPSITRKTDRGLPRYYDAPDAGDVFILSGVEDLVPVRIANNGRTRLDTFDRDAYRVQRYRPRVEGLFARIECWRHRATGDTYWRAITRDNVLSIYGRSTAARVADPDHPEHVFAWLLEETRDDRGNVATYTYKAEDSAGVSPARLSEASRFRPDGTFTATAQRYPKRVRYGNRAPVARDAPAPTASDAYLFEIVFDYGEHDDAAPTPDESHPWALRPDPFSTRRPAFEVRSYRLCRRVLMFHRFPELGDAPCLVRSTDLAYAESHVRSADGAFDGGVLASCLASATQAGYVRNVDGAYQRATMPPLELGFTQAVVHDEIRTLDREHLAGLPGTAGAAWVDLDGEGIPGLLRPTERAWFYQPNLGDGRLATPALQHTLPAPAELRGGAHQLVDLGGDGNLDLVRFARPLAGYFARTADRGWNGFTPFHELPNLDWTDPNLRFIDADGDGLPDVLITEHGAIRWYRSRGADGFGPGQRVPHASDEARGPAVVFADGTESIHLADMTGDGLSDLVRVRCGEVSYWPNLGRGQFGPKITLDGALRFDRPDQFEPRRVRFADIDGSGTSDLVYCGNDGARAYFNLAGNALSPPLRIRSLPPLDDLSRLEVVDLLGHGTACLVWSSAAPARAERPVVYVDLLPEGKPHLLATVANNLGGERRITYAPSTRFYLDDQAAGRPWLTRLPFPVHLVAQVEHQDHVAGSRLVTRYRYHHGYYDGYERELGGFACVEQWDAESFLPGDPGHDLDVPPVRTVTWFHTGAWLDRERLERGLAAEYYHGDPDAPLLPDTRPPPGLSVRDEHEATRGLRGHVLRTEIYAEDDTAQAAHPYAVSAHRYEVRVVQSAAEHEHAVVFVHPRDQLDLHYERQSTDPRVQHDIVLAVDDFGDVTQSAAIAYPRRQPAEPEQARLWATVTDHTFAHVLDAPDAYRAGAPVESTEYELTGLVVPSGGVLAASAVQEAIAAAAAIAYEADFDPASLQLRQIARERHVYYRDDLSGALPLGQIESRTLPHTTYTLALTPGLVALAYGTRIDDAVLTGDGHYVNQDALWWAPSSRAVFDAAQFYLATEAIDPFGEHHHVAYDDHALLAADLADPVGNHVTATHDYRVLRPAVVIDPNGNRSAVAYDALGMPVATALMGKAGAGEGDTLADPTTRLEYDLHRWQTAGKPAYVHTLAREQHGAANKRWLERYAYWDGSGRVAMTKVTAEPGADGAPRWVGTGRTVFDNKGHAIKQYEPFFSVTSDYEDEAAIVEWGVTPILHHDPVGRLVRTDLPDGTYTKVVFDAWRHEAWDASDTVADAPWLARMQAGSTAQQRAATLSLAHAGTPTVSQTDALGRSFLVIADNGAAGMLPTRSALDTQGRVRTITDPRGVVAVNARHDPLGRAVVAATADAGQVVTLFDVVGKPVRSWNARAFQHRQEYDPLRRPTCMFAQEGTGSKVLVERTVYGESHPEAVERNLRGRPYLALDAAGALTNERYDFAGNLISSGRRLAYDYHATADWSALAHLEAIADIETAASTALDPEVFTTQLAYDALERVVSRTTPDASEAIDSYDQGGQLEQVVAHVRGAASPTAVIDSIDYNARRQRLRVDYGNGTSTVFSYNDKTSRLIRLRTTRTSNGAVLQDLAYTYDAAGHVVQIDDAVSFGNPGIAAGGLYTYDAVYRLTTAEGREHPGQQPTDADSELLDLGHPNDMQALARYREHYTYDAAGNILAMAHAPLGGGAPGWTRSYRYVTNSNRLLATSAVEDAPGTFSNTYSHDPRGNMTAMPHLTEMRWDHADRLTRADRGGGGTVYVAYDASGHRARKIYEHGGTREERIYLGDYEVYRRRPLAGGTASLERQTLHVPAGAQVVALVESKTIDTSVPAFTPATRSRFQLDDHLGSSCLELDGSAAIITYEEYFPFGGTSFRAADTTTDVSAKRYRYTGNERDDETGLAYHGARYYATWLGRWTAADPAGPVDSFNLYVYVRNDPLGHRDPSGNKGQPPQLKFGSDVHRAIARYYMSKHPLDDVFANRFPISGILNRLGLGSFKATGQLRLRPDIYNATSGDLYEIKPFPNLAVALSQALMYVTIMSLVKLPGGATLRVHFGAQIDPGARGVLIVDQRLVLFTSRAAGTIEYEAFPLRRRPDPDPSHAWAYAALGAAALAVWKAAFTRGAPPAAPPSSSAGPDKSPKPDTTPVIPFPVPVPRPEPDDVVLPAAAAVAVTAVKSASTSGGFWSSVLGGVESAAVDVGEASATAGGFVVANPEVVLMAL